VVAKHVVITGLEEPARTCLWLREVALTEGVEGWASAVDGGVEAWFEGSIHTVDAMVDWCQVHAGPPAARVETAAQRPSLRGGFEVLDSVPSR
jgi:acylphosphatase